MTEITRTFRVGYRWRCTMATQIDDALVDCTARPADGGQLEVSETWRPKTPRRLSPKEESDYAGGKATFEEAVVRALGGRVLVFETPGSRCSTAQESPGEDMARLIEAYAELWLRESAMGQAAVAKLGFDAAMDGLWDALNHGFIKLEGDEEGFTGLQLCDPPEPPLVQLARPARLQ
jgi:hypothetical protein